MVIRLAGTSLIARILGLVFAISDFQSGVLQLLGELAAI